MRFWRRKEDGEMARKPKERKIEGEKAPECRGLNPAVTRRRFLLLSGASLAVLTLPRWLSGGDPASVQALVAGYPRQKIGQLRQLKLNEPVEFFYPYDHLFARNYLFKLGTEAGGGVGPDRDVVAFNSICTHQGGFLAGRYNADSQVFGPCPIHLTTFDLTRHGMVVSGHATEGLPQITLETDGDDIYATGVLGLVYGYYDNQVAPV
jgi:arsenite oxidase small subunit